MKKNLIKFPFKKLMAVIKEKLVKDEILLLHHKNQSTIDTSELNIFI